MDATLPFPASPLTSPDIHPSITSPTPSPCDYVQTTSPCIFPVDPPQSGHRNTPSPSIMTQTPEIPVARLRAQSNKTPNFLSVCIKTHTYT